MEETKKTRRTRYRAIRWVIGFLISHIFSLHGSLCPHRGESQREEKVGCCFYCRVGCVNHRDASFGFDHVTNTAVNGRGGVFCFMDCFVGCCDSVSMAISSQSRKNMVVK